jgi:hypothetical protein
MFYRRKTYKIKAKWIKEFNKLFNEILLPTQLKYGARLVGRWMTEEKDGVIEVFAIWEYDSQDQYEAIENKIRADAEHVKRVQNRFDEIGRENLKDFFAEEIKQEFITSTVSRDKTILR